MQTQLSEAVLATAAGREAERILRACVHCGFCNATCPTYQLLGDELDGPRGRIYLIKSLLEGGLAGAATRVHLDRCLTCRACEGTCPSGVQYGRLIGIGRQWVETTAPRNWIARVPRRLLRWLLTTPRVFKAMVAAGRCARPFLPERMRQKIPELRPARGWPAPRHARRVLVPGGCVQPTLAPAIDAAAARILDRIGITSIAVGAGSCCGAIDQHLSAEAAARRRIRANIDAWWPWIESGAEAIVVTASGCGAMIKEYGYLLRDDAAYATRAARVSAMARDMAEILSGEDVTALKTGQRRRIAFHSPCSLQHGLRLAGVTEALLGNLGYELTEVSDPHLCCGSAGTYSILQPRLADQLRANKLRGLVVGAPALIATANIGCLLHLAEKSPVPVRHWLELLDV